MKPFFSGYLLRSVLSGCYTCSIMLGHAGPIFRINISSDNTCKDRLLFFNVFYGIKERGRITSSSV